MFVKICGLTTPDAVAAAVDSGADALGFVFAESPRRIAPSVAARLSRDVPQRIVKVAVMRHPTPAEWLRVLDAFTPDWLQTDAEDLAALELPSGCTALPVYRDDGRRKTASLPSRLLFEGQISGSGRTADWVLAQALAKQTELILAGGLDAANVGDAIVRVRPFGIDVSSGVERDRGIKDPRKIIEFVSRVRELERTDDDL